MLGLVAFVLRGIDWPALLTLLKSLDWRWFTVGVITAVGIQVVAGIRWSALARPGNVAAIYMAKKGARFLQGGERLVKRVYDLVHEGAAFVVRVAVAGSPS